MVYKSGQIFLPFCHNPRVWRTDGRTDRIFLAIPRLHYMQRDYMQRGKNAKTISVLNEIVQLSVTDVFCINLSRVKVYTCVCSGLY